jgi:hypothetical protein
VRKAAAIISQTVKRIPGRSLEMLAHVEKKGDISAGVCRGKVLY